MLSFRKCFLAVIFGIIGLGHSNAANIVKAVSQAPNIVRITKDSLILVGGFTRQFSVDSPENQPPVSTRISVGQLAEQLILNSREVKLNIYTRENILKTEGLLETGDVMVVTHGKLAHSYKIGIQPGALCGKLSLFQDTIRANSSCDLTLEFTAGQRSPMTEIQIQVPPGIPVTMDNTTVNVIGRGEVKLGELQTQSIGHTGTNYSYKQVGQVKIADHGMKGQTIIFSNIDLRPFNGIDLQVRFYGLKIKQPGTYIFKAVYKTSEPAIFISSTAESQLTVIRTIADFTRSPMSKKSYCETTDTYTSATFHWTPVLKASKITLLQSIDHGQKWEPVTLTILPDADSILLQNLKPATLYAFKLKVKGGDSQGESNVAWFYSGMMDVKKFGVVADGSHDNTEQINQAIEYLHRLGGGTLNFSDGIFSVRTVHLKSNVYLYIEKDATIKGLKGGDAPELTWFSDKKYRSGLSPTDTGPYDDPENYLTKQDVGHTFFKNAMFFAERLDNVKIIGNGRITGDGNLVTGDKVMNNPPENRADKMFSFKLCTNIEIGGIARTTDLWYDPEKNLPYYIEKGGKKDFDCDNMLNIDRGGHFALLATGCDHIFVHNTYFGRSSTSSVRDIYDFMGCNDVTVTNIFCKVSSDDIVKPGSDCSLGFTRPARNYKVRNIIGDTNCNLFQIGSETADDITDVCVDNIYVLGANKAGFSISTNDGGHVKNIHLNCGHTGSIHSRSKMLRTTTPFFISISNRGRILGANVARHRFSENGILHDELLCTNVNIGKVENIVLNGVDISEVYGGSAYGGGKWKAYDGKQRKSSPIIAGYQLPESDKVENGLNFKLPNGLHTGYIDYISLTDIHFLVKGGNPLSDSENRPPELGVGQYNVSNLGTQPSYGLWARHVKNLALENCSFNYEKRDSRFVLFLDDVHQAKIDSVKMIKPADNEKVIKLINSTGVTLENTIYYQDEWGKFHPFYLQKQLNELFYLQLSNYTTKRPIQIYFQSLKGRRKVSC